MSADALVSVFSGLLSCGALGVSLFSAAECARIEQRLEKQKRLYIKHLRYLTTKTAFEPRFTKETKHGD